ncbi:MAG: hypothetical protein JO060_02655 [Candidatus Eremiobacteraeota bacterium]|nr:hypothetical protein [Candidatus Eremiobacteraeota bacterium]MBV9648176.1 hypothetical protein [Candidatus Eremiobacteraeota bacterium]
MSGRVDPEIAAAATSTAAPPALPPAPPLAVSLDSDVEIANQLPPDHPAWAKDTLSLSLRARALVARLRPIVIRVLTFWDHQVRSIFVGGQKLSVDASGSYRLE